MPRIASFDIGTRNLAVCCFDVDGGVARVHSWEVGDLGSRQAGIREATVWLAARFDRMQGGMPDMVMIETQVASRMTMVAHAVAAFFHVRAMDGRHALRVVAVSPRRKMMEQVGQHKTYAARKKFAVARTQEILEGAGERANETLAWFLARPKRDDLADAFLQGYAELLHRGVIKSTTELAFTTAEHEAEGRV
jgi:Poxvirus A22 protein